MKSWYRIRNAGASGEATVYVYSDIGMFGVGAEQFVADLAAIDADVIHLRINSYGGEVFDAFAMFNAIRELDAYVIAHVDGVAASAATLPMLAADEIRIASNAFVMIHNPLVDYAWGEAKDLRQQADLLDQLAEAIAGVYVDRTGRDADEVAAWMDGTKWMDADEAVELGFADEVAGESDKVPANAKNRVHSYLNSRSARPRVRPSDRVTALGLDDVLPGGMTKGGHMKRGLKNKIDRDRRSRARAPVKPARNAVRRGRVLDEEVEEIEEVEEVEETAVWPDAADVREGVTYGPDGDDYTGTLVVDDGGTEDDAGDGPSDRGKASAKKAIATPTQIKAAFKDDPAFALERVDVRATITEHKAAYADHLSRRLVNSQAEGSRLRQELAKHDPASAGHDGPLNTEGESRRARKRDGDEEELSPLARARAKLATKRK